MNLQFKEGVNEHFTISFRHPSFMLLHMLAYDFLPTVVAAANDSTVNGDRPGRRRALGLGCSCVPAAN